MSRLDCEQALVHLQDYVKRELTPELIAEVRIHLEECRDCAGYARFEESFLLMLEIRTRRETCPKELRERILAALRAERGS
ncbi:MAG: zf-HC2 domain-containing protein [Gemmatimonadales bacterium]